VLSAAMTHRVSLAPAQPYSFRISGFTSPVGLSTYHITWLHAKTTINVKSAVDAISAPLLSQ
jgi:hypothetical protein